MSKLRVQEQRPCEKDLCTQKPGNDEPWEAHASYTCQIDLAGGKCEGCENDGTRYVVVGELVEDYYASDVCGRWGPDNYLYTIEKDD